MWKKTMHDFVFIQDFVLCYNYFNPSAVNEITSRV